MKIVYLDQNHWIELARAAYGRHSKTETATRGSPHIAVPSPPHISLPCAAHQSECGRTPLARGHHKGGTQPMTPHKTGSTTTPGAPPRDGAAHAHVRPPGADPGRSQRRLPPGLPRPAVPVLQHRSRPDRPSRCLLRSRRAGRHVDHLPDPPVPTDPARRRGGHRHGVVA